MIKFIFSLCIGLFSFNTAWADAYITCDFVPGGDLIPPNNLRSTIYDQVSLTTEKYNCRNNEDGYLECDYRWVWNIPNRIYSTSVSINVQCINLGDKTDKIAYNFTNIKEQISSSDVWKNLTMTISGIGPLKTFSNLEKMDDSRAFEWSDGSLAPCQKECWSMITAWPRYTKTITFKFTVQPKVFKLNDYQNPYYDLQDAVGTLWMFSGDNKEANWSTLNSPFLSICGLDYRTTCNPKPGGGSGGSGGGIIRPPIKQCTLTVVTPDVVAFQPISSDDLSRGRVRSEDFTMTVIKGPDQSTPCMGSAYNLPGEIKTQGGYPISSTFWGISHSSGAPQGIGLKLFDLGKGSYLNFNHRYSSFIKDISSISESKRIRAEISATTKDLKKIKDGEYSQVLTFEVAMP
ncbi:hypothetical protein [Serratia sp. (in: enterobacteria)]|uniref:hypothetical protein n=1 Tax=Serratia sp. (in: enterobacteria) TaxID=616 RepID=UPI00398912A4